VKKENRMTLLTCAFLGFILPNSQIAKHSIAVRPMTLKFASNHENHSNYMRKNMLFAKYKPRHKHILMDTSTFVPDMQRRSIMNCVLLASAAVPVTWLLGGFLYFLVPPSGNSDAQAGTTALDANGDAVLSNKWIKEHPFPERSLVQGLRGDAHYLIVKDDNTLEQYALNAVCTHLGCVVPWNRAANKYMCPCHGSQYDSTGKVIRGPAPLSLALAHVSRVDNKVLLTKWTETDFRTDEQPWWK
tara:strand:- start:80 stop:811 length:732 start_codon:yes stop_codon:yes gene_type:complete